VDKTTLGNALNATLLNTKDVISPRTYSGEEEYNKTLVTDKGEKTRQILKDGLADILTFGMGALTNLYSPMGLAAGASAVANRHSAMNKARTDYVNALNNNLNKYDTLTSLGVKMPMQRDAITGNTDLSYITPSAEKLIEQQAIQDTFANKNNIMNDSENRTIGIYDKVNGVTTTPITTDLPKVGELKIETQPTTNDLPAVPDVQNVNYTPGAYGTFGQEPDLQGNVEQNTLQGAVQQNATPYLIDPKAYEYFYDFGRDNVKNAKDLNYKYYDTDTQAQTSRENNMRTTQASVLNNLAKGQQNNGRIMPAGSATDLSATLQGIDQMNELNSLIDKLPANLTKPGIAQLSALNPWDTDAQAFNQYVKTYKQVIGKGLEGGVLRKEDEYKYDQIIPKVGDTADVLKKKTTQLNAMLINKYNTDLDALQRAGYSAGNFDRINSQQNNTQKNGSSYPDGTVIKNKNTGEKMIMRGGKWQKM